MALDDDDEDGGTADRSTPLPTGKADCCGDETLLQRIATRRDKTAFEVLFHRYAGRIKGMLIKAGATPGEADEVAQEAMLAIWRKAHLFDPAKAGAATWIFTIARNRRIDLVRRAQRPVPDPNDPLFQPDPVAPAEADIAAAERDALVREAVAELSEDQRTAVRLAFFEGLSHPEVSERTGAPLGTIKSRLRLATKRLRVALGDQFGEELFDD
ncbi:MAG: sigma-70 family RNA polymerase sigma factor [Pikeienuella sp.]